MRGGVETVLNLFHCRLGCGEDRQVGLIGEFRVWTV